VNERDDDLPDGVVEGDEDLVGPRRGGTAGAEPAADEAGAHRAGLDSGEGPRLAAPRLRRGTPRKERRDGLSADTLVTLVRDIPSFIKLLARLLRDPRVSRVDRAIVGAVLVYFVMPVDLIPDLALPVLGQIDDIYFLALALSRLVNNAGVEVLLDHWDGDPSSVELLLGALDRAGSILPGPARVLLGKRVG
jgi:uncharacterized membrane protein YkvA (DUF1232 family)